MMTNPFKHELVSVIIPCYNHAHFLGESIESALRQTYPHIEIIVVDDGSTDHSAQVAAAYPSVRYVRQDNLGLSRARNVGLSYSNGIYIVFLDADDCLFPDAIDIGVRALASRNDCALTFGRFVHIGISQHMQVSSRDRNYNYKDLLQRNFIGNPGSVLYRRWVFTEIGEFDEANSSAADYDLYLRVARQFPILCHHQLVVQYRTHGANMSNDLRLMLASTATVLKKQWKHVKGNQELRAAYEVGRRHWKTYYGEPLIVNMCENIARGNVMKAACDCYTLVRLFPERFPIFVVRKIGRLYSALRDALF